MVLAIPTMVTRWLDYKYNKALFVLCRMVAKDKLTHARRQIAAGYLTKYPLRYAEKYSTMMTTPI